jgi:transposase InsO family protein
MQSLTNYAMAPIKLHLSSWVAGWRGAAGWRVDPLACVRWQVAGLSLSVVQEARAVQVVGPRADVSAHGTRGLCNGDVCIRVIHELWRYWTNSAVQLIRVSVCVWKKLKTELCSQAFHSALTPAPSCEFSSTQSNAKFYYDYGKRKQSLHIRRY